MTEKNSKQEVDILALFSLIGKKINSFLYLIINLFISFLNLTIRLFFLMKRNYLILLIFIILGSSINYAYNKIFYVPEYNTTLTLSPNFGSSYQLYQDIKYYQSLLEQKDFEKLSHELNIDTSEAKSILSILIEPYKNEFIQLSIFKEMLSISDSVTSISLSYQESIDKIPFDSYSTHIVSLKLSKNKIPKLIEESIIMSQENNIYFKNKKNVYLKNLKIKKDHIKASIQRIDTLLFSQKNKSQKNLDNSIQGTTILIDENQNNKLKYELFSKLEDLNNDLVFVINEMDDKKHVINKVSSFKQLFKSNPITNNNFFVIITSLLIGLIIVIVKDLIKYLNNNSDLYINKLKHKKYNSTD
jgi:hypothetical protein